MGLGLLKSEPVKEFGLSLLNGRHRHCHGTRDKRGTRPNGGESGRGGFRGIEEFAEAVNWHWRILAARVTKTVMFLLN